MESNRPTAPKLAPGHACIERLCTLTPNEEIAEDTTEPADDTTPLLAKAKSDQGAHEAVVNQPMQPERPMSSHLPTR